MNITKVHLLVLAGLVVLGLGALWFVTQGQGGGQGASQGERASAFARSNLMTNTAIHSIPLDQVIDGGPGKDGIPALTDPAFTSVRDADKSITDDIGGILVRAGGESKFYPYNILVWHEVVNDTVGSTRLVVTFCPLCGSAVVYDATVEGRQETFGVSGKLYNSNLLMYDKTTESLWSQVQGEAVVGDRTGKTLTLYPSQVVPFKAVREQYPDARVLSVNTGHRRDYSVYPYGRYDDTEELYFPVAVTDTRLPAKEIMHVVNWEGHSVAFKVKDLTPGVVASVEAAGGALTARIEGAEIRVTAPTGAVLPGYTTMWFAWAVYHQKDGIVWTAQTQR